MRNVSCTGDRSNCFFVVVVKSYQICCPRLTDNNLGEVKSRLVKSTFFGTMSCSFFNIPMMRDIFLDISFICKFQVISELTCRPRKSKF